MRKIAASCSQILLCAITLFFVGPQLGSLDTDGDGIPDVPVVLMDCNNQKVQAATSDDGQTRIGLATTLLFLELKCSDLAPMKGRIVLEPRSSRLELVAPLLC
jgi:hypothetical protein